MPTSSCVGIFLGGADTGNGLKGARVLRVIGASAAHTSGIFGGLFARLLSLGDKC